MSINANRLLPILASLAITIVMLAGVRAGFNSVATVSPPAHHTIH